MENHGYFSRHKRWILPLAVLGAAFIAFAGLSAARTAPPEKPHERIAPLVDVTAIELSDLQMTVQSRGLVTPKYQTDLVAQVSGEILAVSEAFSRGGLVQAGDLLARIDPTNYQVQVEEARAAVASAEAALELELAQSRVARAEWEKVKDMPVPELGLRKPQLAQAQARVTAARAALKQAQKDLDRTRVVAPYDALVAQRDVSPGTYVSPGSALGQLLDVTTAEVRLPITRTDLQYLSAGGIASDVLLRSDVGGVPTEWRAAIRRSEGVIDADTRMTYLVAEVDDPYQRRKPAPERHAPLPFGSYVEAAIEGVVLPHAVEVPRHLIREGRIALARDGKLSLQPVDVARSYGGISVVAGGLNSGDLVVATALDFPVEGMALDIRDATLPTSDAGVIAAAVTTEQSAAKGSH